MTEAVLWELVRWFIAAVMLGVTVLLNALCTSVVLSVYRQWKGIK